MFADLPRIGLIALILLSASCAQKLTPQEVASQFWLAIEQGDAHAVKRHITAADSITLESLEGVLPISSAQLRRIVIEANTATIDTTVTVDGDKPLNFPLKTYLALEDERWKVDYEKTIAAVATAGKLAEVIDRVHEFGKALQLGIERSIEEFEKTLPQIKRELSRIEAQIKQRVPELRRRLERLTQELQEAVKHPPKIEETDRDAEGTRAI